MWKLVAWFGNSYVAGSAVVAACDPILFQSLVQSSDPCHALAPSSVRNPPMNVRY